MEKKKKSMWAQFKAFALRGNLIDLAIGVIIGGAFGRIVSSLVNDLVMPLVGAMVRLDFSQMFWVIRYGLRGGPYATATMAVEDGAAVIDYGNFFSVIVDFFLIAISIFLAVKLITQARNGFQAAPEPPPPRLCRFCCTEIHKDATRCPHCTSELS